MSSLLDILRGRPSRGRVADLVIRADRIVDSDPAGAISVLTGLGERPWVRDDDPGTIGLGFAIRAYAAHAAGDPTAAMADLVGLATLPVPTPSLLPLVPVLALSPAPDAADAAQRLVYRHGGCGGYGCSHTVTVEASLGLIRAATPQEQLLRWAGRLPAQNIGASLRVAAFAAAGKLGPQDRALSLIVGDDPRLGVVRARLAYDRGDDAGVLAEVPPNHELAVRSSLRRLFAGVTVPAENRAAVDVVAVGDLRVRAILAEAEGRLGDAAEAWAVAGDLTRSAEASVLGRPAQAGAVLKADAAPAIAWYAYAAGDGPRPATAPSASADHTNLRVGDRRALYRAARKGDVDPARHADDPSLAALAAIGAVLREKPIAAASLLRPVDPTCPPAELLAELAGARAVAGATIPERWREWAERHGEVAAWPRPVSPIEWLVDRLGSAVPGSELVADEAPETAFPTMAAAIEAGAPWALAAATRALQPEALAASLPASLPDLPALAFAVAYNSAAAPDVRQRAAVVAAAALANGVTRRAWPEATAEAAVKRLAAAVADLVLDPETLTPEEAYGVERDTLDAFPPGERRRATGPVLTWLAAMPRPDVLPDGADEVYLLEPLLAALLLRSGRVEAAHAVYRAEPPEDTELGRMIAEARASRLLDAKRPADALHALVGMPDPSDMVLVEDDLIARLTTALVKSRDELPLDLVMADTDTLREERSWDDAVRTLKVELLLERTRRRPGSPALDVDDLEEAYEIDPEHPVVARQLSGSLIVRAMEELERSPRAAVADVDRATDIYMGDREMAERASEVAYVAAGRILKLYRDVSGADQALGVALAINRDNRDALQARVMIRSRR